MRVQWPANRKRYVSPNPPHPQTPSTNAITTHPQTFPTCMKGGEAEGGSKSESVAVVSQKGRLGVEGRDGVTRCCWIGAVGWRDKAWKCVELVWIKKVNQFGRNWGDLATIVYFSWVTNRWDAVCSSGPLWFWEVGEGKVVEETVIMV